MINPKRAFIYIAEEELEDLMDALAIANNYLDGMLKDPLYQDMREMRERFGRLRERLDKIEFL